MTPAKNTADLFRLSPSFVATYATRKPPFGFNGLGELVYLRTYSRLKDDGTQERWHETVERVVNGTYTMQKRWILSHDLGWSEKKAQKSAQEMYDRIWNMKFLPPGRGLWAMGSPLTEEKGLFAALNNCAFVSTINLDKDLADPFTFLMDASMLGIGVGFDTKGAGKLKVHRPKATTAPETFVIPDTREGWVKAVELLLLSYFTPDQSVLEFDFSKIRPAGEPIKGFGGVASGPDPLKALLASVQTVLDGEVASATGTLSVTGIVDIMNLIGTCVVAGNVRRTAEIAFGEPHDEEFIDLKNYEKNPQRAAYGWTSNNSIFADIGMDYGPTAERVAMNGEPGYAWLENMRAYGRMGTAPNHDDWRVMGANPCVEQSLESYELCCLVETFPANHESYDDYERTLKYAYLYAKTVTLGKTPWARTNRVMLRNRRIGLSQSGIQQAIVRFGIEEYREWCENGYETVRYYDNVYSEWLTIPKSVKVTSVKPSGSVSLLAGATPGMHWPEDLTYIRRMRLSKYSDLVQPLKDAGYHLEEDVTSANTLVVEIPVKIEEPIRTAKEVSLWEQLSMAAFLQKYWADNQVSATVTFDPGPTPEERAWYATLLDVSIRQVKGEAITPEESDEFLSDEATTKQVEIMLKQARSEVAQIAPALNYFQYQLKGVSFLPRAEKGAFAQMPYESITEATYDALVAKLSPVNFGSTHEAAEQERFCSNDSCTI